MATLECHWNRVRPLINEPDTTVAGLAVIETAAATATATARYRTNLQIKMPTPRHSSKLVRRTLLFAIASLVVACTSAPSLKNGQYITLPMRIGWVNGLEVRYVTTDVSDDKLAVEQGANLSFRLADATRSPASFSLLERVYKIANFEQRPVFQSAPLPVGPQSTDTAYSPLWRLILVTWKQPSLARELKSEQQILDAEDSGLVTIRITDLVLNCPILYVQGRGTLSGVTW